jgi:hypothetical protein
MNFSQGRRARLRPEHAHLFPEVVPMVWMSARRVARLVHKRRGGPAGGLPGGRVLRDEHFEFQGESGGRQYLTGVWVPRHTILE